MIRLALLFTALSTAAHGQGQTAAEVAAPILDDARAVCQAEAGNTAELLIEPGALTWVALDEPDLKDDLIVDFNHILCSLSYSLWHGTGGSRIFIVLNGETTEAWSGGLWRMTEMAGWPLLLIGRHGSACDG